MFVDYFEIYKAILEVIHDERITNAHQLFEFLSDKPELVSMRQTFPEKILVNATLETLDNLIDDGLIVGKSIATKDGKIYFIERLSTSGQVYLLGLQQPKTKDKFIDILKTDGFPITPQSVIRTLTKILL